jgi:hypothetical protein
MVDEYSRDPDRDGVSFGFKELWNNSKGLITNPLALGVIDLSIHMKKPERWSILPV